MDFKRWLNIHLCIYQPKHLGTRYPPTLALTKRTRCIEDSSGNISTIDVSGVYFLTISFQIEVTVSLMDFV